MESLKEILSWLKPRLKHIYSFCLAVIIGGLLAFLWQSSEVVDRDLSNTLIESDRGILKVKENVVFLGDVKQLEDTIAGPINESYFIKREFSYQRKVSYMRDRFDFSDEDYDRVIIYRSSNPQKPYKTFNLLELLQKDYPDAYITNIRLLEDTDGHSYIGVSYSNVDNDRGKNGYRLLSIETGEWATTVSLKENESVSFYATNIDKVLSPYHLEVSGYVDAIRVHFSDISASKLQELNIGSDKDLISLMKEKKSGTLYFFGDDALERVSHLLAKKGKRDMMDGVILDADKSKDGKRHRLSSYEDFKNYSR